jgi:hypothetical protein
MGDVGKYAIHISFFRNLEYREPVEELEKTACCVSAATTTTTMARAIIHFHAVYCNLD